jgi:4-carboxymuconolactone decarboxylase
MTSSPAVEATLRALDEPSRLLVRLAAVLAAGSETEVRAAMQAAHGVVPAPWVEELTLQTYLFAGFPRALNGMRQWRRLEPRVTGEVAGSEDVRASGEETCARVYGGMYDKLRVNIRELHPLLDDWMIVEGYGKVLSRPGLDLLRRELCIVAACAASGQDRQLQSHLHGARNAGATEAAIAATLAALEDLIPREQYERAVHLWQRVRHDVH